MPLHLHFFHRFMDRKDAPSNWINLDFIVFMVLYISYFKCVMVFLVLDFFALESQKKGRTVIILELSAINLKH